MALKRSWRRQIRRFVSLAPIPILCVASCRSYDPCDCEGSDGAGGEGSSSGGMSGHGPLNGDGATPAQASAGSAAEQGGAAGETSGSSGPAGESNGGAGASAEASAGSGGGESGGLVCKEDLLDCDASTANGCETNPKESVWHCGACGQECTGICIRGDCLSFELLVNDQYSLEGNIALGADHAYLSSKNATEMRRLLRVSRRSGEVQTLAPSRWWEWIEGIAVGERLYVSDFGVLNSLDLDGSHLLDERIDVESIAATRGFLYYSWFTALYRRAETPGSPIEVVRDFPEAASIQLASSERGLFLAVNYPSDLEPERYEIYEVYAAGEPEFLTDGKGRASGLAASFTDVYFVAVDGPAEALYRVGTNGTVSVLEADAGDISGLAAADGALFATFSRSHRQGLRLYASESPPLVFEWETKGGITALVSTPAGELWFLDPAEAALARVNPFPRL